MSPLTPRVFIVRHGETEWSLNGRHTSTSDLPLTSDGEKRVIATGKALVGNDRLIVPEKLAHIYVSPRTRARQTLMLMGLGFTATESGVERNSEVNACTAKVTVTSDVAEWDYGDYEGLTSPEIRKGRIERGLDVPGGPTWDIWRDGCEGGESPEDVAARCDRLIQEIREKWHKAGFKSGDGRGDVVVVAHGHFLRAFAMRWVGKKLDEGIAMLLEAGGVGTLSYEHHSVHEPAILLGGAFTVAGEH
ncbi:histidine phosphatase superfamily [Peziza echinospora]|nr:histidine phosphatase superfamily [Peziza echinospora]